MIGQLCQKAGIPRERIYEIAFAGNTTMQQLLCGVDTSALGEVPFAPATGRALTFPAAELGLHIHPRGSGYVMPVIGGFVGGDTVAGVLATGMAEADGPTLFVDIGTNGEIVLQAGGKLRAASTAAGPAFEGARISCGMRGCTGAIEKVVVDGRLRTNVIGNVPPVGLCGSGLIDVAAELLRHGLLTPQGRLQTPDQLPSDVLPDLAQRLVLHEGKVAFLLASAAETGGDRPIVLTQRDLRELQLATGAIRAGIAILLRQAGLGAEGLAAGADRRRLRQLHPPQQRPTHRTVALRDRAPADPLHGQHVAGRRPVGGPVAAGPATGRTTRPPHRARRPFDRRRVSSGVRRVDDLSRDVDDILRLRSRGV